MNESETPTSIAGGITLRDYFAALSIGPVMRLDPSVDYDAVAHHAYMMADAMLKARESQAAPHTQQEAKCDGD